MERTHAEQQVADRSADEIDRRAMIGGDACGQFKEAAHLVAQRAIEQRAQVGWVSQVTHNTPLVLGIAPLSRSSMRVAPSRARANALNRPSHLW